MLLSVATETFQWMTLMSLAASCMTAMACSHDQFRNKVGVYKAFGLFDARQCVYQHDGTA